MDITCWNVHCDINQEKYTHIMKENCDILILLECTHRGFESIKKDWEYCLWYNDTLYENTSDYGIAIFANKYRLFFTDIFNRNLRFVIPLKVFDDKTFLFYLFAVWTKAEPIHYSLNVLQAIKLPEYQEYVSDKALFIGDFNTNVNSKKRNEYDALINAGLIDCLPEDKILPPTYSHTTDVNYFTADYCLATKAMKDSYKISEKVGKLDDSIPIKDKYERLSDHCPIFVNIKGIQ